MSVSWLRRALPAHWQHRCPVSAGLLPLAVLYGAAVQLRRGLHRAGLLRTARLPVPVVVIGNVTAGGTGKTPLVIWLVRWLRARDLDPGVILRGYGGTARGRIQGVGPDSDPAEVGDEAVLIARRAGCPVVTGRDRAAAGRRLLALAPGCNVIVCDDGLQHLSLGRDVEVAVIDGERRLGNGWWLPAGPLREGAARLCTVDAVVCNGGRPRGHELAMTLDGDLLVGLTGSGQVRRPSELGAGPVHAVAGIGNPGRFFHQLESLGLDVIRHPFPDHHAFVPADLAFRDGLPVIMTEKDAVKCRGFHVPEGWYLPVEAKPDERLGEIVLARLLERTARGAPG